MFTGRYFDWNQKRVKEIVNYYGHKFMYRKSVLDLGCGYGDIGGALHRLGADVTAVDARQDHLKMVAKKFAGVKTVCADLDRDWPFRGKLFDLVLDLGLLCHLADFEKHLRAVCASAKNLILETAVCDSNDALKSIPTPENKGVFDLAYNGMGCRPSPAAIERVLHECGMTYKRMDSARFNSGDYKYDWTVKNDGSTNIDKRRIWFCSREGHVPSLPVPPLTPAKPNSNVQFLQDSYLNARQSLISTPKPPQSYPTQSYPTYGKHSMIETSYTSVKETVKKFAILPGQPVPQFPNLKVLYLPLNDATNEQTGMYDAWRKIGVNWKVFDFYRQFLRTRGKAQLQLDMIAAVKEFQPDLIFMQVQFTGLIDSATLTECRRACPKVIITNWSGDIRQSAIFEFITLTHAVDYSLISSTGQLDMYSRAGCTNVRYLQIGYDPVANFPMYKKEFLYDACFIGNNYGHVFPDGRVRELVANRLGGSLGTRFGLFGNGYGPLNNNRTCTYKEVNQIYNNTMCPISISNFNNVSHYFSDRLLHCLASGRPTISWWFPGCTDYFEEGKEIFYAKSDLEVLDIINKCRSDPEMATQVGEAGYQKALREHTYTSRVLELIDMIGIKQ